MSEYNIIREATANYAVDSYNALHIVDIAQKGITYKTYNKLAKNSIFEGEDWLNILQTSERTLQRYAKDNKRFGVEKSERILEILMLVNHGIDVLGDAHNLKVWVYSKNLALGGVSPIDLLNTSVGIGMLRDSLSRFEHGIFA